MLAQKVRSMGCEETKRAILLPSSFLLPFLVIYSSSEHGRVNGKYDFIFGVLPNDHECDLHIRCHVNDFAASKKSFNDTLHLLVLQAICLRHAKKRFCLGLLLQLQIQHACKFGFRRRLPQKEFQ